MKEEIDKWWERDSRIPIDGFPWTATKVLFSPTLNYLPAKNAKVGQFGGIEAEEGKL